MCVYATTLHDASQIFAADNVRERLDKAAALGAIPMDFTTCNDSASEQMLRRRPDGVERGVDCCGYVAVNQRLKPQQNYIIQEAIKVTPVGGGIGLIGVYAACGAARGRRAGMRSGDLGASLKADEKEEAANGTNGVSKPRDEVAAQKRKLPMHVKTRGSLASFH
ncbi:hypothetical protein DL770_009786 [Monosporascus sp. CRB-9-2]|nr:hypothetical protein DL770_009786 [Monosporascus sp. CRB-9-2]